MVAEGELEMWVASEFMELIPDSPSKLAQREVLISSSGG